jgi:hypothetical protein
VIDKNLKEIVTDIMVCQNLKKKYINYCVTRPGVPASRKIRLPFFGICPIVKTSRYKNEYNITLAIPIQKAKEGVLGMIEHIKNMDQPKSIKDF